MKKHKIISIAIGLATLPLALTPIVLASCFEPNQETPKNNYKYQIVPTYVSQADNLIALQITPDYYPRQLFWKKSIPYDYLNPKSPKFTDYIYQKPEFANSLKNKLESIQGDIKEYGNSWWSFSGNTLEEGQSEEFWTHRKGSFVLYDRYLIDNSHFENTNKKLKATGGPIANDQTTYPVDFKMSRDLYFSLDKNTIKNFESDTNNPLFKGLQDGLKYLDEEKGLLNPLFNFSYFAKKINDNFLDANKHVGFDFNNSAFAKLILDSNDVPLFYAEKDWKNPNSLNSKIYKIFQKVILTEDIKKAGLTHLNYKPQGVITQNNSVSSSLHHHPVFEQNLRLDGGTQAYLGTMRDSLLYLYDIAFSTVKYAMSSEAKEAFKDNPQKLELMKNALINANEIVSNLIQRIKNIRNLFKKLKVVDNNYDPENKVFDNTNSISLALFASSQQSGSSSSLQTQSKYGFLYYDLGFKPPKPTLYKDDFEELLEKVDNDQNNTCHAHDKENFHCHGNANSDQITNSIFNMDDNGWWWNLGEGVLKESNFVRFKNQFDLVINIQYLNRIDQQSDSTKTLIRSLLKEDKQNDKRFIKEENYELWNEGIRSPIGYNQILDSLIKHILSIVDDNLINENQELVNQALAWGSYWDKFVSSK